MKRANVSDVARLAGVSTATVSRVLNDPGRVRAPTREKVLKAIDELKFVKSATAFSFKVQHTHNVLVLVAGVGNIYYSEVFQGLQRVAEAHGYNITLASPDPDNFSRQVTERLRSGRVDGVIALDGFDFTSSDLDLLTSLHGGAPPAVGFAEKRGLLHYPHVLIDNERAAHMATRHLIEAGHQKIGLILGPAERAVSGERLAGYRRALGEAGIAVNPGLILPGGFQTEFGRLAARRALECPDRPTAMCCANDEVAMGFISELHNNGLTVPEDMSVVGFDDTSVSDVYVPALTTIAQPKSSIGEETMRLLLEVMRDPVHNAGRVVELDVRLVPRDSVAPPPEGIV